MPAGDRPNRFHLLAAPVFRRQAWQCLSPSIPQQTCLADSRFLSSAFTWALIPE